MEEREIIIIRSKTDKRKGIIGIGRNINEFDKGKRMVRVAPTLKNDRSFCVNIYDNNNYYIKPYDVTITDIDNNYIYCSDDYFIDYELSICEYNDGNWMIVDDFIGWIQKNNLDNFKKKDSIKSNKIKSNSIKSYPFCNPNPSHLEFRYNR
jgi:hypothetical protein